MTHLGHLVRWDMRRFRAIVLLWLVVIAATAALGAVWPRLTTDSATRQLVGTISSLLALTEVLLSLVLVAQVVHAHALVGTTAFWMTRPIPRGSLLTAKLVLLGTTMIAAPVAADVVVMAIYQVPTADIIGVSIQAALSWALWIGALATLASMTPNLAKYALAIGGALIAAIVTIAIAAAIAMYHFENGPPRGQLSLGGGRSLMFWGAPDPTSGLVATVLAIVALMILLIVQYRTRRRELAVSTGIIGALVTWSVSSFWPWSFFAPVIVTPAWAANPVMLTLTATADTVVVEPIWVRDQTPWRQARARIRLRGIQPGWTASVGVRNAAVQVPNGAQLISNYSGFPSDVFVEEHGDGAQQREVVRTVLGVGTLIDQNPQERAENTIVMFARDGDLSRLAPNEGIYRGRFYVGLTHHTVEAVLAPAGATVYQNGPYHFSIADVQLSAGRLSMLSEQSDAVSMFARRPPAIRTFYLRNQRTSQAILLHPYDLRPEVSLMGFLPFAMGFARYDQSGFSLRAEMLYFAPRADQADGSFALDQQWLNEAELIIMRSTPGGSVDRQLAIANFPIRSE